MQVLTASSHVIRPWDKLAMSNRDAELQLARRVDWRFLLPKPDLPDTAYVGRSNIALLESLKVFSASLQVLSNDRIQLQRFSLVVAHTPTATELQQSFQAVKPGGHIYVEVCRETQSRNAAKERIGQPNDFSRAFRRQGLLDVQLHWHWPDFDACCELVPCMDQKALVCALRRRGTGFRSSWKSYSAALLVRSNLITRFIPCFSILGHQPK